MIVSINDRLWKYLWPGLRERHWPDQSISKDVVEASLFSKDGIRIISDDRDGRWQWVELPRGEELIELILRYGNA